MSRPDVYVCPGCGNPIATPKGLNKPGGWLLPDAWCTWCGGKAARVQPPALGPRWYARVAAEFDKVSAMPLVLDPDTVQPLYEQAFVNAEACAMEPEGEEQEALEREAAERTALAIAILAYGPGFIKGRYTGSLAEIEADRMKPEPRTAVELVNEAYFLDPTVSNLKYGELLEEADQMDRVRELEAEAASAREE